MKFANLLPRSATHRAAVAAVAVVATQAIKAAAAVAAAVANKHIYSHAISPQRRCHPAPPLLFYEYLTLFKIHHHLIACASQTAAHSRRHAQHATALQRHFFAIGWVTYLEVSNTQHQTIKIQLFTNFNHPFHTISPQQAE